jgi:hypothetical protein
MQNKSKRIFAIHNERGGEDAVVRMDVLKSSSTHRKHVTLEPQYSQV